jgi:uncharacterized protein YbjT (DUF2867 family)
MNIGGNKLKLLLTGASGFIGHEVAHQLALAGFRPRLMIAHPKDDCEICHLDADFVLADLTKPKTLKDAVRGVDGIDGGWDRSRCSPICLQLELAGL